MGRFTTGDIEYKFMVAVQSSRAADRFGYLGETIFYEDEETKEVFSIEIHYIFDKNDLRYVKEELENIKNNLTDNLEKIDLFFNSRKVYQVEELALFLNKNAEETFEILHEYADFRLGNKIKKKKKKKGKCEFYAEI